MVRRPVPGLGGYQDTNIRQPVNAGFGASVAVFICCSLPFDTLFRRLIELDGN